MKDTSEASYVIPHCILVKLILSIFFTFFTFKFSRLYHSWCKIYLRCSVAINQENHCAIHTMLQKHLSSLLIYPLRCRGEVDRAKSGFKCTDYESKCSTSVAPRSIQSSKLVHLKLFTRQNGGEIKRWLPNFRICNLTSISDIIIRWLMLRLVLRCVLIYWLLCPLWYWVDYLTCTLRTVNAGVVSRRIQDQRM